MKISILLLGLAGASALGCASAPAAPFNTMKSANVSAFRLQNYEPPPQAAATPAAPGAAAIPGIPPEIMQMAQQALPGLQQFLPPGLIPPGMLQGGVPTAPVPQVQPQDAPRFPMGQPNFRILSQAQVIDPELKDELAKLLGDEDNFQADHANCLYAEMGISFTNANGGQPNDLLVSFSCNQVEARSFPWPHSNRGLKPDTVKKLVTLSQKIWPGG